MCDTWVALRDTTAKQQVIFAKNSDRPIFDCQPLMLYPRQQWPAGTQIQLEYIQLPQLSQTYATLGSSPYWAWGYEQGINEHRVAIGNEAIYTKTFKQQSRDYQAGGQVHFGLLGMDLIRLALERSRTAQQAVAIMGELIEQYGQFGSAIPTKSHIEGGYDNSFIIADPSEAWVLEAVGKRWVAQRFTKGYSSISNQLSIRQKWDAGSADIEAYSREQGWWSSEDDYDFARAYIDDDKPRQVSHIRQMRSRQLLAEASGNVTPEWMMRIARDHYEGTFLHEPYFDAADPDFLTLCMHVSQANFTWGNTASSCVAVLPESSNELPVFWWTAGPPCNGCYVPFFPHGSRLPAILSRAGTFGKRIVPPSEALEDQFASNSYWWLFRKLIDRVKGDPIKSTPGYYFERNRRVREQFDKLETEFKTEIPQVVAAAQSKGDDTFQAQILDNFTANCVSRVVQVIQKL
jgi:secernin